ncbi:MAG TPA: hypothetical protein VNX87_26530 [Candidatus Sulfotelmatobacter sp.]|jgi:hypothetical protein|nr:hypothetical protein [Candidatus Sulfotelmatobacter sp.]
MMPQSNVFVAAPLKAEREAELRNLLASMNLAPGQVDPNNSLFPFSHFDRLHFARFLILQDGTLDDIHDAYGLPRQNYPLTLAFIADVDGDADDFRKDLATRACGGLRRIFACCESFTPDSDLERWLKDHEQPPAASYVNWVGRSVQQIHEDDSLRIALETYLQNNETLFVGKSSQEIHKLLREFARVENLAGRLKLTDDESMPILWWLRKVIHFFAVPLVLLALSPLLLLYLPIFIYQLRSREKRDPEIAPRPNASHEAELAQLEDIYVTNQFSAMGSIKPGLFRRWTLIFLLWLVNYAARHFFVRGHLARVPTIHFARWVFLNDKRRMIFASNYDGSLDSYMDDFINKVGWGLNLAFSNGIGYPATNWLVLDGSKDEQKFKYFLRRHQMPTQVWYDAHTGLSAFDLKRNMLIRRGIDCSFMSYADLQEWIALF